MIVLGCLTKEVKVAFLETSFCGSCPAGKVIKVEKGSKWFDGSVRRLGRRKGYVFMLVEKVKEVFELKVCLEMRVVF